MKNFKLKKGEELKKILKNIEVKANDNKYILTLFLTTERLVLLKDINKDLEYNTFLLTRLVEIPENLEVVFDLELNKIKSVHFNHGINEITFIDNDNILKIYAENISKYLKNRRAL